MTSKTLPDQANKRQIARMERASALLTQVVTDVRERRVATAESVALVSSCLCSVALLNSEIGRHLMGLMDDDC
jgi:hypothetical protein